MRTLDPLPVPDDVNSFWYLHNPASHTAVVFVHGIFSDSRGCWTSKTGVYWPALLIDDSRVALPSIYMGGYTTFPGSGDLKINDCARELFDDMNLGDRSSPAPLSLPSLVFVCHSTGGIVVRYMLERYQKQFSSKRLGLVLMASPSLGSDEANKLEGLLSFYNQQLGQQLKTGNESLFDIDNRFRDVVHKRLLAIQGVEAYEHYFVIRNQLPQWVQNWSPNWGRRVVQPFSAGVYFGAPKLIPRTDHFTIVKPPTTTHPSHRLLIAFLQEFELAVDPGPTVPAEAPVAIPPRPVGDRAAGRPMLPLTDSKRSELWATLDRIRRERDTEFGRDLRVELTERTLVVRRPDAILTEVATLVNETPQPQGNLKFGLFTDSPSQFKDLNLRASAKIGEITFEPSVSLEATEGGHKFIIVLGFKGNLVKPGGRITLQYTARYPSSVALNDDYWVFPAERIRPGARFEFTVKFPVEPADVACYRIAPDETRERVPFSGPVRERQADPLEELLIYRVTPENPAGYSFVMTWRLENER
jgi:hypothetical protein